MNLFTNLHNPITRHNYITIFLQHIILYILKLKLILLGQSLDTLS